MKTYMFAFHGLTSDDDRLPRERDRATAHCLLARSVPKTPEPQQSHKTRKYIFFYKTISLKPIVTFRSWFSTWKKQKYVVLKRFVDLLPSSGSKSGTQSSKLDTWFCAKKMDTKERNNQSPKITSVK